MTRLREAHHAAVGACLSTCRTRFAARGRRRLQLGEVLVVQPSFNRVVWCSVLGRFFPY